MQIPDSTGEQAQESVESTEQDTVAIPEATDEELEAFISGETGEGEGAVGPEDETESESPEGEENPEQSEEPTEDESVADEDQKDDTKQTAEPTAEELKAQQEKLTRQVEQNEQFIKRRNEEIGRLRQQVKSLIAEKVEGLEQKYLDNPAEATKDQLEITQLEQKAEELEEEEVNNERLIVGQKFVAQQLSPEDMDVNAMCEVLKQDGADPRYIEQFRSNPLASASPMEVVLLGRRGSERKRTAKAVTLLKALYAQNQELKKQAKEKPKRMLNRIEQNLKATPASTFGRGTKASSQQIDPSDISSLSDEELNSLIG